MTNTAPPTIDEQDDGAVLTLNLHRRCGGESFGPVASDVVDYLRESAGRLSVAASAIEEAFGQKPGLPLSQCASGIHEIRTDAFNEVHFVVQNANSEAEAFARVRELIAGLQAAGVAG